MAAAPLPGEELDGMPTKNRYISDPRQQPRTISVATMLCQLKFLNLRPLGIPKVIETEQI